MNCPRQNESFRVASCIDEHGTSGACSSAGVVQVPPLPLPSRDGLWASEISAKRSKILAEAEDFQSAEAAGPGQPWDRGGSENPRAVLLELNSKGGCSCLCTFLLCISHGPGQMVFQAPSFVGQIQLESHVRPHRHLTETSAKLRWIQTHTKELPKPKVRIPPFIFLETPRPFQSPSPLSALRRERRRSLGADLGFWVQGFGV